MNYEILKCLETIQECLNNLNSNSCNEVKEKCIKKLKLELSFDITKNKNIKKYIKTQKINNKNVVNYVKKFVYEIQQEYIEKIFDTKRLRDIFNYLKEIELNKKENDKKQLEQIKKEIEKENFDNEIKDYLIEQIDNYIKQIELKEKIEQNKKENNKEQSEQTTTEMK